MGANYPPGLRRAGPVDRNVATLRGERVEQPGNAQVGITGQVPKRQDNMASRYDIFTNKPVIPIIESVAPLTPTTGDCLQLVSHWVEAEIASYERNRLGVRSFHRSNSSPA